MQAERPRPQTATLSGPWSTTAGPPPTAPVQPAAAQTITTYSWQAPRPRPAHIAWHNPFRLPLPVNERDSAASRTRGLVSARPPLTAEPRTYHNLPPLPYPATSSASIRPYIELAPTAVADGARPSFASSSEHRMHEPRFGWDGQPFHVGNNNSDRPVSSANNTSSTTTAPAGAFASFPQRPEDNARGAPIRQDSTSAENASAENGPSSAIPKAKKRARNNSSASQLGTNGNSAGGDDGDVGGPPSPKGKDRADSDGGLPAVLVREKKQKACANCRRAKLKCIVESGQTDCVRCRARTEKCVFYPRSHDEDWQQTLTQDVYQALTHLGQLSSAVGHLLHHLSYQNMIPRFVDPDGQTFEPYIAPERDMFSLQGWGAERNSLLSDYTPKNRRRKRGADGGGPGGDGDDDDRPDTAQDNKHEIGQAPNGTPGMRPNRSESFSNVSRPMQDQHLHQPQQAPPLHAFQHQRSLSQHPVPSLHAGAAAYANGHPTLPPRAMSMSIGSLPPMGWNSLAQQQQQQQQQQPHHQSHQHPHQQSINGLMDTVARNADELPPIRQPGSARSGGIQLTPTSELDLPHHAHLYTNLSPQGSLPGIMPPPPSGRAGSTSSAPAGNGGGTLTSPLTHVTPNSIANSSPAVPQQQNGPGGAGDMLAMQRYSRNLSADSSSLPQIEYPPDPPVPEDDPVEQDVVVGSSDTRINVIKKGIIDPQEATYLIKFFHHYLSRYLLGFQLQFNQFPFLSSGRGYITPFILAVECLLSSERIPKYYDRYHASLGDEVLKLLLENPAESWQSFEVSMVNRFGTSRLAPKRSGSMSQTTDALSAEVMDMAEFKEISQEEMQRRQDPDWLDPELGIGPEEIVGAVVLSLFMSERQPAADIASSAFKWARGWVKMLTGPERDSVAEAYFVPEERKATLPQMARVWLLCYVVDGIEAILHQTVDEGLDPSQHMDNLVPRFNNEVQTALTSPMDMMLHLNAHLVQLMRKWLSDRHKIQQLFEMGGIAPKEFSRRISDLSASFNNQLEWWREELENYTSSLPHGDEDAETTTKMALLLWNFAKASVNGLSADTIRNAARLRSKCLSESFDGAMGFLDVAIGWDADADITNLPQNYLGMVSTIAGTVRKSLEDIRNDEVAQKAIAMLQRLGSMLHKGGLPDGHNARNAAEACFRHAREIEALLTQRKMTLL